MIFAIQNFTLPLEVSFEFDVNELINHFIQAQGMTFEEFDQDWIVEVKPVEVYMSQEQPMNEYGISYRQDLKIRRKTKAERQPELEVGHDDDVNRANAVGVDADLPSGGLAG